MEYTRGEVDMTDAEFEANTERYVLNMYEAGWNVEEIASALGLDTLEVERLLGG